MPSRSTLRPASETSRLSMVPWRVIRSNSDSIRDATSVFVTPSAITHREVSMMAPVAVRFWCTLYSRPRALSACPSVPPSNAPALARYGRCSALSIGVALANMARPARLASAQPQVAVAEGAPPVEFFSRCPSSKMTTVSWGKSSGSGRFPAV